MKTRNTWRRVILGVALATASSLASKTQAEDTITTGDGLLSLTANMPAEVRAGEEFSYTVTVTNESENVTLHNIELKQLNTEGFSVESTMMGAKAAADSKESAAQQPADSKKAGQDKAKAEAKSSKQDKRQETPEKDQKQSSNKGEIKIAALKPGESKTITVKAAADNEGELRSCLAITNYMPAICLTSQVIKPELQLTKVAPEQADRCNVIELVYTVKNGGSGDVGPFVISDSLGEGMATIEGKSDLMFKVDGLKAGDSRKFVARVYATKPGTFTSRATAKAENNDLSSRSKETTTKVIAAQLDVQVKGPSRLYGKQLAKFTAHVTNTGNSPAEAVNVKLFWPEACDLVDLSEPSMESSSQPSGQAKQGKGKPTPADDSGQTDAKKSVKDSGTESDKTKLAMSDKMFTIERLDVGQTAVFEYAIRSGDVDSIPTKVEARYVCDVAAASDQANARSEAVSTAMATAKVIRMPAMELVVVDDQDPVPTNSNVVYSIRVWNEGDATESDVSLKAQLPEGLEFVSAKGPTENSVEGSTVTFEPLKALEPGDRADYRITAKSTGDGDVRFKAMLKSKSLNKDVVSEESTRLVSEKAK